MASWLDQFLPLMWQARMTGQTIPIPGTGMAIHPSGGLIPINPGGSLINNLPIGQSSGLFGPTAGPVGSSITMPTINVTAPRLPAYPVPSDYGSAVAPGSPLSPVAAPQPTQDPYRSAQVWAPQQRPQGRQAVANQAAAYRSGGMTTDQLNAASLAAAQQGRTYLQQGPYPSSGNIVGNALMMPPSQGAPIMLAPTQAAPYSMPQQNGYTLNPNQGLY